MKTPKSPTIVETIENDLHDIAARLAGIESILRQNVESPDGNVLHLLAEVTRDANQSISNCASKLSDAMTGGTA